ncbi:MAG: HesA/MoeB/ThiF family protein [Thermodesulfobacteriota bacterium]
MGLSLSEQELVRYSRNIVLPEIGLEGQERLKSSGVLLVGAGGIGSPSALYLAAAGVGHLGLVDFDAVEVSNLQRQILFQTRHVDGIKVECAREAIHALNPHCKVATHLTRLKSAVTCREIVRGYDVVIDGSDNFCTRFLVADCCWIEGVTLVSASALGFQGQLMVVVPGGENPCYRCLIPEPSYEQRAVTCREAGIFGGVVGVMGSLAAVEAVKFLLGLDPAGASRFLAYDGLRCRFVTGERLRDPDCILCGEPSGISDADESDVISREKGRAHARAADSTPRRSRSACSTQSFYSGKEEIEPHE